MGVEGVYRATSDKSRSMSKRRGVLSRDKYIVTTDNDEPKYYDVIGTCAPYSDELSHEELFPFQWMGIAYINAIMGDPPDGCEHDVIWANYDEDRYVVIAILCSDERMITRYYTGRAESLIERFSGNVNWHALLRGVSRISRRPVIFDLKHLYIQKTRGASHAGKYAITADNGEIKFYDLIGKCGPFAGELSFDQLFGFQRIGIAYLNAIMGEPPKGCRLDVIWANDGRDRFASIALLNPNQHTYTGHYTERATKLIEHLNHHVNWPALLPKAVSKIMARYVRNVPDGDGSAVMYRRLLEAFGNGKNIAYGPGVQERVKESKSIQEGEKT